MIIYHTFMLKIIMLALVDGLEMLMECTYWYWLHESLM